MTDLVRAMAASASGMTAQTKRLRLVSENIANTDTPGYRRKTVAFEALAADRNDGSAVRAGRVQLDRRDLPEIYDPAHPMADADGYYLGSTVDLVVEIADSREAQRSYEANLRMLDQARRMTSGLLELLRR